MIKKCREHIKTIVFKILQQANRNVIFLFFFSCCNSGNSLSAQEIIDYTGDYEGAVKLSYDSSSKEVSGFIQIKTDSNGKTDHVSRSCSLFFKGNFIKTNNKNVINYYFYGEKVTDGYIVVDGKTIYLKANSGDGYCNDILDLTDGIKFNFSKYRPYLACETIRKDKAYIYSLPNSANRTKMYLIEDDFVSVLKKQDDWLYIEYSGKKVINGWIKKDDTR